VLNDIFLDFVVATRHNRFTGSSMAIIEGLLKESDEVNTNFDTSVR